MASIEETDVTEETGSLRRRTAGPSNGDRDGKLKKFTFSKETKYVLLQAVRMHNAHRAPHGKKDEYYSKVLNTVVSNLPATTWASMQKPTMKTMRDKFRAMMADRKETNKRYANSSGIDEVIGPADQLLDDFLLEVQESEESRQKEREEANAREEAMASAGEQIQRNALTRRLSVGDEGSGSSRSTPRKRRAEDQLDGWKDAIERELQRKRQSREKELELRSEELKLSKEKWEQEKLDREHSREQSRKQMDLLISFLQKKRIVIISTEGLLYAKFM